MRHGKPFFKTSHVPCSAQPAPPGPLKRVKTTRRRATARASKLPIDEPRLRRIGRRAATDRNDRAAACTRRVNGSRLEIRSRIIRRTYARHVSAMAIPRALNRSGASSKKIPRCCLYLAVQTVSISLYRQSV